MICDNPYNPAGATVYACGSCPACRKKRNWIWKTRLILESFAHAHTAFVTLTYRPEELPHTPDGLPTITPRDLSLWLKKFRKAIAPSKIRYYAVGEYGSKSHLPHFHLIVYGYQGCHYGRSRYRDGRTIDCCAQCDRVRDIWGKGIIETEVFSPGHGGYISGYILKGLKPNDRRLEGRYPERSWMSLKPGIGFPALETLTEVSKQRLENGIAQDVTALVRIDGKPAPIGSYLMRAIRLAISGEKNAPQHVIEKMASQMLPLWSLAQIDKEAPTLRQQIIKQSKGAISALKAAHETEQRRRKI